MKKEKVTITMPSDILEKLKVEAKQSFMSLSGYISKISKEALDKKRGAK